MSPLKKSFAIFSFALILLISCSPPNDRGAESELSEPKVDRVDSRGLANSDSSTKPAEHKLDELVSALFDRSKWERLFRFDPGETSLADKWGKKVWASFDAPGFVYRRTELFSVGGVSHWIIVSKHEASGLEFSLCPGGVLQFAPGIAHKISKKYNFRQVDVDPFLIARTEVTQEAWSRFMDYCPSSYKGTLLPVETIDLAEAKKWCQIAGLRLPSEYEWEFACRAGSSTVFFFGDSASELDHFAWYDGNIKGGPQPVGTKLPNMFGLMDILGNVSEIVDALLVDIPKVTSRNGLDSGLNVDTFVIRGGSWANGSLMCQSDYRSFSSPLIHGNQAGFRAAASVVRL